MTILLVDDDKAQLELTADILGDGIASNQFQTAATAEEALKFLAESEHTITGVVTDFNTKSGKTGWDVVLACDAQNIPVILVSGNPGEICSHIGIRDMEELSTYCNAIFLAKPVRMQHLMATAEQQGITVEPNPPAQN